MIGDRKNGKRSLRQNRQLEKTGNFAIMVIISLDT